MDLKCLLSTAPGVADGLEERGEKTAASMLRRITKECQRLLDTGENRRLKPCPYCGGEDIYTEVHLGFGLHEAMTICRNCGARVYRQVAITPGPDTSQDMIKQMAAAVTERMWNTRVYDEYLNE